MKKLILLFIVFVLVFSAATVSFSFGSQNTSKVLVNGTKAGVDLKMINNKPYVDALAFSQSLGLNANMDKSSGTLNISFTGNDILIPEIIKNISPSVVGIVGTYNESYSTMELQDELIHGTGLVIKSNGEILTNAHVVKDMAKIVVILSNGDGFIGKLKYIDENSDLAVVKIEKSSLPAAKFGTESEIITGKTVIAIGTPVSLSLRNSASTGVISGINRGIDSYYKLIQTDASINPGNSGGPLVSLKGNVIGINSSKFAGEGIEGLGFSIPLNTIQYVLSQFDKYGYVNRPYLGMAFDEDWAAKLGLPSNKGINITSVEKGSPADLSGIKADDILLKIGAVKISTIVDLNEVMKNYSPHQQVVFLFKRGTAEKTVKITLGSK